MGQGTKCSEEDGVVETYLGYSWFASVDTCIAMYQKFHQQFIGVVKTAHSCYPKKFLEDTMADWPAVLTFVLELTADGAPLLAMGYKYNKRKVMCFVATKGAGHREPGTPYEAKWKDDNGSTCCRDVPRPKIIMKYFLQSNKIGMFN
jgi:hypothetical protein